MKLLVSICLFFLSTLSYAQNDPDLNFETQFDKYTVRHVVFNSTFIQADVARAYGIKRSKNESMLNISLSNKGELGSLPATVSGTTKNLLQQQKQLEFKEIAEKDATYYLAPIRVGNEEKLHFEISVTPKGSDTPLTVIFTQTVYADE